MNEEKNCMLFEHNEVEIIIGENGEPLFELYSTGKALGQTKIAKGKVYARKDRIEKNLENADIKPVVRNGQFYLTEEMLYDFMLEAKTEKCRAFRKWVTSEVLPQIRKTGGYIPIKEEDDEKTLLSKALIVAQRTIEQKDSLIQAQNKQLEEQKSFVDFVKTIETSKDSLEVGQFIKIVNDKEIDLGRNGFFCWLREKGYLNKRNEPYQRYIDQELFEVREGYYYQGKETKLSLTTLITAKGQRYFVNKLREEFCKNKIND